MTEQTTRERIISAAIELTNEKGYKGATTRAIAERADVNEVTLFRQFGSKKGIVEAAIQKYSFVELLSDIFDKNVVWDLRKDLRMLVLEYQRLLDKKRDLILISFKESGQFPELDKMLAQIPQMYKEKIEGYLLTMKEKGKLGKVDVDAVASNFIYINFGYFMLKSRLTSEDTQTSIETFIDKNIEPIIQSLL